MSLALFTRNITVTVFNTVPIVRDTLTDKMGCTPTVHQKDHQESIPVGCVPTAA